MLPTDAAFLKIASDEIKALEKRLSALNAHRESVLRELAAWRVLYLAKTGDELGHRTNGSVTSSSAETDKTAAEIARELISTAGIKGITPNEITQYLRNLGLNVSDNFASTILYRMKQNVEVIAYRKRYYLVRFAPTPKPAGQSGL